VYTPCVSGKSTTITTPKAEGKNLRHGGHFVSLHSTQTVSSLKLHLFHNIYFQTPLKENYVRGSIVAAVYHVRTSAMLLLHFVGIRKIGAGVRSNGITFIPRFYNISPIPRAKLGNREIQTALSSQKATVFRLWVKKKVA
jgi:hypothetical protein